ncbi:MAG: glycosyltransferase [Actinobacteria bacterium]|nr:glycosyltransferase [Actinomycetota bacterium]
MSNEIEELRRLGHRVTVIASRGGKRRSPPYPDLALATLSLRRLLIAHARFLLRDARAYIRFAGAALRLGHYGFPWSLSVPAVMEWLETQPRVDHIHTHFAVRAAGTAELIRQCIGCSRSVTTHAADIYLSTDRALRARLRNATVGTVTDYNRKLLTERGIHVAGLVRCGVHIPERSGADYYDRGPVAMSLGRLVPKKGHDTAIRGIALRNAQITHPGDRWILKIVGDGPELARLKDLSRELDSEGQVQFLGSLNHNQVLQLLRESRALVLACKESPDGDADGLPVAILEAAALKTPIIAGLVTGISEFVDTSTGAGYGRISPSQVADSLLSLELCDPIWTSRVEAAYHRVGTEFSLRGQAESLIALIAAN